MQHDRSEEVSSEVEGAQPIREDESGTPRASGKPETSVVYHITIDGFNQGDSELLEEIVTMVAQFYREPDPEIHIRAFGNALRGRIPDDPEAVDWAMRAIEAISDVIKQHGANPKAGPLIVNIKRRSEKQ